MQIEAYRERDRAWIETRRVAQRTLKIYGITKSGGPVEDAVVDAARSYLQEISADPHLLLPSMPESSHGFVILHAGEHATWLILCLWSNEILHVHTHAAPIDAPQAFAPSMRTGGAASCVWELEILVHERSAWIEHVLRRPEDADFAAYEAAVTLR